MHLVHYKESVVKLTHNFLYRYHNSQAVVISALQVSYSFSVCVTKEQQTLFRNEFYNSYSPIELHGREWRAISWTTAASVSAIVEMVADGVLPNQGFIKQEDISYAAFMKTANGSLYENVDRK